MPRTKEQEIQRWLQLLIGVNQKKANWLHETIIFSLFHSYTKPLKIHKYGLKKIGEIPPQNRALNRVQRLKVALYLESGLTKNQPHILDLSNASVALFRVIHSLVSLNAKLKIFLLYPLGRERLPIARLLIENGADVNAVNKFNNTALISAAEKGINMSMHDM